MTVYKESGLNIDLSDFSHFRFKDLPTYEKLNSHSIKEMDFVFVYQDIFFVLEVKDYTQGLGYQTEKEIKEQLIELPKNLVKKVQDSLLLLSAISLNIGKGALLREESQFELKLENAHLIIGLRLPDTLASHHSTISQSVKSSTHGYAHLFDLKIGVVDYQELMKRFTFIQES